MGSVKCIPKKFKNFRSFFDENAEFFLQKLPQHTAQLNSLPAISAKGWHFEDYCKDMT